MLAVAFDTLKLARKLESAGMAPKLAQDTSAALAETLTEWHSVGNLATKDDVHELKAEIQATKAEILKWVFSAFFAQTFIILGAIFGAVFEVVHMLAPH
jgi:hypothetical protein